MTRKWMQTGPANYRMIVSGGARYLIDRFDGDWVLSLQQTGDASGGRTEVPWLPGRRSLPTARASCEAHAERAGHQG